MSEGPTTAGSIVGKLKLDKSEWDRDVLAAKAQARELGAMEPTIKVDANVNEAMAKIAAVDTASTGAAAHSVQVWQLVGVAIAAAVSLLGPLLGFSVGVAGGLSGMGAAGVLAFLGIAAAIKQNTDLGRDYKTGLGELKSALDSLSNTAAVGMLADFRRGVDVISQNLPALNKQIGTFTQILGATGLSVLKGTINAFKDLNPLFVAGAQYVQRLADGFLRWTQGGGLQKFTAYALSELPIVEQTLSALATTVVHVVEAFAPFGTSVLTVITLLANVINAIPVEALSNLIAVAGGVFLGFQAWNGIRPIIEGVASSLGVAADTAFGPWGLAIAGAIGALSLLGNAFQTRAADVDTLTSSLDQNTGAITKNTRASVVDALQKSGAIDAAKKLGISLGTVTDAAMGNQDAVNKINQAMTDYANNPANSTAKVAQYRANWNNLVNDIGANNDALKSAIQKSIDQAKAMDLVGTAQAEVTSAMKDAQAAIKQNGATWDLNTAAGQANKVALDGVIQGSKDLVNAKAKEGASQTQINGVYETQVKKLLGVAAQMGLTGAAADTYVRDHLGKIPPQVTTNIQANTATATGKIQEFTTALNRVDGRVVTIYAQANIAAAQAALDNLRANSMITANMYAQGNAYTTGKRDGGTITAASGITVPGAGSAQFDSVHALLAPTEEVISNRFGQADRNRPLLKAVNAGASPSQIAEMAVRMAGGSGESTAPIIVHVTSNGVDLSRYIDVKVERSQQSQALALGQGKQKVAY